MKPASPRTSGASYIQSTSDTLVNGRPPTAL